MFYEGIGRLLSRAAVMLAASDAGDDAKAQRANRGLTVFLRRLGAVWPDLFGALRDEIAVLEDTLERARKAAATHDIELPREAPSDDPVAHYGGLERELDALVACFHEADADWAQEALRDIRHGMLEAAEIQGRVVEGMLAS